MPNRSQTPPPDEPQEPDPPDLDALLHTVRVFLFDVINAHREDDIGTRATALRRVVIRAILTRGNGGSQ